MTRPPSAAVATAATAGGAVIWGTSFIANDLGLEEADAVTFTSIRFLVAALSGWILLRVLEPESARRPPWGATAMWVFGGLNAAAYLLQYLGQERTSPARAALFVNANVFTVALLQLLVTRERLPSGMVAAAAVSVAGVALLTTGGDLGELSTGTVLGDALTFGGGAAWAVYLVVGKKLLPGSTPLSIVAWTMVATAVLMAPVGLVAGSLPTGPVGWSAIAYTGLFASTVAYALWAWGLRTLSATASAVVLLLEVPVATGLSLALGLDGFTVWTAAGAALLFSGVAAASLLDARREPTAARPAP